MEKQKQHVKQKEKDKLTSGTCCTEPTASAGEKMYYELKRDSIGFSQWESLSPSKKARFEYLAAKQG